MIHRIKVTQHSHRAEIDRIRKYGRFSLRIRNGSPARKSKTTADSAATRLRKKLFCIDGRSPAKCTNILINAKQNADSTRQAIPRYSCFRMSG